MRPAARYAAADSVHPVAATAAGEVLGQLLETAGRYPDVALVAVTDSHAGALEDIAAAVDAILEPTVVIGAAGSDILGPSGRHVAPRGGLVVWAGFTGPCRALRLSPEWGSRGLSNPLPGWEEDGGEPFAPAAVLVLGDRATFATGRWAEALAGRFPSVATIGLEPRRAAPALWAAGQLHRDGAVGAVFGAGAGAAATVVTAWRPVGPPLLATRVQGHVVYELDGVPAMRRLAQVARDAVPAPDLAFFQSHLGIGPVDADLHPTPVRRAAGRDPDNDAIVVHGDLDGVPGLRFYAGDPAVGRRNLRQWAGEGSPDAGIIAADSDTGDAPAAAQALGVRDVIGWSGSELIGPWHGRPERHGSGTGMLVFGTPG